ncbi:MAG: GMC oxidoreductase [Dehalococcoidia bacterium]
MGQGLLGLPLPHAYIQVMLRCTVEGSGDRNDTQICPLFLESDWLPSGFPIAGGDNCFAIFVALQNAATAGELRLTSLDPQVQPSLNYRYLSDPWDLERMRKAVRLAVRLAEHTAFRDVITERVLPADADLASDEALNSWILCHVGTEHHSSGTCKMGPANDPMAVVDASVMPDVVRVNTNCTTIMIGERAADFIREGR